MNGTVFLLTRKLKNRIKVALCRPSEIAAGVLFAFLIVLTFVSSDTAESYYELRSVNELYAIVFALYAFLFIMTAKNGFVNGASMFSMADVNFLFTSPRKPKRVLSFGLLNQLGRSLMLGVFILYQYSWAHDLYGVNYSFLIAVLVGYAMTVFLSQMLAMLIYSLTSKSDKMNSVLKAVFYAVIAAFAFYAVFTAFKSEDLVSGAVAAANSSVMKFFPVAGFVQMGVVSFANKEYTLLLISVICFVCFCALYYIAVSLINADYYEDVLKATEVSFSAVTARKEGKASENAPKNIKVGKTGITKGEGANTIYEKHKVENRRGRILLLDTVSVIMIVITLGFAFVTKSAIGTFAFNIYITIFTVGTGRWAKELLLPYVYLIPEPPFKKLINMLKEQVPSIIAESVLTFVPLCFLIGCPVGDAVGFSLAKCSFAFLFVAVNLIFQRFFGNGGNKALLVMLFLLAVTVFSLPFIITFVFLFTCLFLPSLISLAAASVINIAISLIILFCCRNVLECAEYNNK